MKIVKTFLILSLAIFGVTACDKSDIKPGCPNNTEAAPSDMVIPAEGSQSNGNEEQVINGRTRTTAPSTGEPEILDIVGSGDDDRDGGDKKGKSAGR